MTELVDASGTERVVALSREESEVAGAILRFALENCPIDGGIVTDDGCTTSLESAETLRRRLGETSAAGTVGLSAEEATLLRTVATYALETCPVGGGIERDDGQVLSEAEMTKLRERLEGSAVAVVRG